MLNAGIFPAVSNVFCSCQKLELLLHFKNVAMFPTFWKCRNISYILEMQEHFLHSGNAGIFPTFFQCLSAVVKS